MGGLFVIGGFGFIAPLFAIGERRAPAALGGKWKRLLAAFAPRRKRQDAASATAAILAACFLWPWRQTKGILMIHSGASVIELRGVSRTEGAPGSDGTGAALHAITLAIAPGTMTVLRGEPDSGTRE